MNVSLNRGGPAVCPQLLLVNLEIIVEPTQELRITNRTHLLQFHSNESNAPVETSRIQLHLMCVIAVLSENTPAGDNIIANIN